MSLLGDIAKVAKAVVKSPITKVAAGGLAIVFPPVGVTALAGIAAAEKIVDAADKGQAILKAAHGANAGVPQLPGGRAPIAALHARGLLNSNAAQQAVAAAKIIKNTAALAKQGNPDAARALRVLQTVKAAKGGNANALASLRQTVKAEIAGTIRRGRAPDATDADKRAGRMVTALVQATAARKVAARKFGVNRQTARIVRVA